MLGKKPRKKGIQIRGVGAERTAAKRVSKSRKTGKRGIQISMIRILAMRSYVERVFKTTCTFLLQMNVKNRVN